MAGILDGIAAFLQKDQAANPQLAGRHPSDNADISALQLAPAMAKGLINDVVKYGSQAATGEIDDGDFLQQQPLTGQAKAIADAVGSGMGAALNYQVPSLMRGPRSVMDDITMAVDAYQGARPGLVDAVGEPSVNRVEGAGLLGSMFIPAKVPKPKPGGLFSQASIASDNLQRKTGNADGFFNDLTGKGQVKPDELNAMGFKENFAGRNDVSRQEVQQFVNDNQVQIKETVLGRLDDKPYGLYDDDDMLVEAFATRAEADAALDAVPQEVFDRGEYYRSGEVGGGDTSKFRDYTLNGGDNYREILLQDGSRISGREQLRADIKDANDRVGTLKHVSRIDPSTDYFDELEQAVNDRDGILARLDNYPNQFVQSGHFEEPDVLAHLRMKDRVDTDGNKTLLLEEVQSDWHQTGADQGYKGGSEAISEATRKVNEANIATNKADQELADYFKRNEFDMESEVFDTDLYLNLLETDEALKIMDGQKDAMSNIDAANRNLVDVEKAARIGVPDAPFKTDDKSSWYNLALKRGLLEAVEGGYDKLALTTGRQQADRYDLSKQINEVRLGEEREWRDSVPTYTVSAFDKNDNPVIMQSIESLDELPNLIGKDAAKSLVDQPLTDTTSGSARILAGQDLSIGGEGMKQFYDRTLPNALGKLVKQDGVKVGQSDLGINLGKFQGSEHREFGELSSIAQHYPDEMLPPMQRRLDELTAKASDTVHSIDITPEMRERVKKGLPLFATGGAAIGLAEMMSQQPQEDQRPGLFNSLQY